MVETFVTAEPIDTGRILRELPQPRDGAVLVFVGTVRDENDGRAVRGMRYDAYADMADRVLREIAGEALARWGVSRIIAGHRTGELGIGDVSVIVGTASPHRADAFEAGRYIIEEIKLRLPVWKQEHYEGESAWLDGARPPVAETSHE